MKKFNLLLVAIISITLFGCCSINNGVISQSSIESANNSDYTAMESLDMTQDNINLKINGQALNLQTPVYLDKNRYYLCLNDVIDNLQGNIQTSESTLKIDVLDKSIIIDNQNNKITTDGKEFNLKKELIKNNHFYYISFLDLSNMLNLYTRWDITSKTLNCKVNDDDINNVKPYTASIEQKGFLRLEDVTLTALPYDTEYFEKLRIMTDYLGKRNVPYHIAWIPRCISPANKTDIDPLTKNDFQTAELIYTLDYITYHNGSIGLHGYTHQQGSEDTGVGSEFGPKHPSVPDFEDRIQKAINTAKYLDIPIDFYEAPHYEMTSAQNIAAEKYFKILYYPFKDNGAKNIDYTKPQLSPHNNSSYYISAYLDYVHENGENAFINKIQNANTKFMGSMFFHPRLDFKNMTLSEDNGIPQYTYSDNSMLKKVIDALETKGYKMSSVKDI